MSKGRKHFEFGNETTWFITGVDNTTNIPFMGFCLDSDVDREFVETINFTNPSIEEIPENIVVMKFLTSKSISNQIERLIGLQDYMLKYEQYLIDYKQWEEENSSEQK